MAVIESIANRRWAAGLFAIAMLWLGLLIGFAFLATPTKFPAPSLSLPVSLDVGRQTFYAFNKVEWVLVAVPTQNSECRRNARIPLAFGVLSRDTCSLPQPSASACSMPSS